MKLFVRMCRESEKSDVCEAQWVQLAYLDVTVEG